ncbi:MAG: hypothetical protein ABMA25_24480 [Ilumatobacteraceae bacterium]
MGFFKDIKTLKQQGQAISDAAPPMKDRMADASARMANANQMMAGMAQSSMAATAAMTNGVSAVATITGATQTGMMMNFNPVVNLDLLVLMPNGVPMPVTRQEPVQQLHLGRCQPGLRLNVKVDPNNVGNLRIDWVTPVM